MARNRPDDDDRPRRKAKSGGMPVWGWVLLGVGGFLFVGGIVVCGGLMWAGRKAVDDMANQNTDSDKIELQVDQFVLQAPVDPVTIIAKVRLDDYYNFDYRDANLYYSFRARGSREVLHAWAIRSSAAGKSLYEVCKDAKEHLVTIKIHRIAPDGTPTARGREGTQVIEFVKVN